MELQCSKEIVVQRLYNQLYDSLSDKSACGSRFTAKQKHTHKEMSTIEMCSKSTISVKKSTYYFQTGGSFLVFL